MGPLSAPLPFPGARPPEPEPDTDETDEERRIRVRDEHAARAHAALQAPKDRAREVRLELERAAGSDEHGVGEGP